MDVDGFDPYEDEYEWRDALETMGEQFQEKLAEKGIKRRLPKAKGEQHVPGTVLRTPDGHLVVWGDGEWKPYVPEAPKPLPPNPPIGVETRTCPECDGTGGVMVSYGNPSNGYEWEMCDICRGTGDIPVPDPSTQFKFKGF